MKNLFGGAVINYGPVFPFDDLSPDGSLFYLIAQLDENPPGLYLYASVQDFDKVKPGDQTQQHWIPICVCTGGGGGGDDDPIPDTYNAICPITVRLPSKGTFTLPGIAETATIVGTGAPGTATKAGAPSVIIINGQTVSFPGSPMGVLTPPEPILQVVTITGENRAAQYSIPKGGSIIFCYSIDDEIVDDGGDEVDVNNALCPLTVRLARKGGFTIPANATSVNITGAGAPGTSKSEGAPAVVYLNGQTITFPGSPMGVLDPPDRELKTVTITGDMRRGKFDVPGGAFVSICYNAPGSDPDDPDTDIAECPVTASLGGIGQFQLVARAKTVNINGAGAKGTASAAGANTTITVAGQSIVFAGSPAGVLTSPQLELKVLPVTGANRDVNYNVPIGGRLSFCYNDDKPDPDKPDPDKPDPDKPDPDKPCGTFKISTCEGLVIGYGFSPSQTKDPKATVAIMGCDASVLGWIFPTSDGDHTIAIENCEGVVTGYALSPTSSCGGGDDGGGGGNPPTQYTATFQLITCEGDIEGLAFGLTDTKDPLAIVPIKDCTNATIAYIYPTQGPGHMAVISHCANEHVGYAVNPR